MVPEGTVGLPATNLYSLLVKLLGLDEATVVLKWTLSLGERFNQYSFYNIVLLNVYLAVSMCDSNACYQSF